MTSKKSYFTVTEKGQVTIPRAIRKKLGIEAGTRLRFETDGDKLIAIKETVQDPVSAVFGAAGHRSTDKIMERLRPHKP